MTNYSEWATFEFVSIIGNIGKKDKGQIKQTSKIPRGRNRNWEMYIGR